eukprot:GEMP01010111.1.p1 GENE.GEMP01010111.1~~GEMP01010111.1.p1  ORF type:complete len:749 (+),score=160.02 GEMP01010111.1:302-2548(+)
MIKMCCQPRENVSGFKTIPTTIEEHEEFTPNVELEYYQEPIDPQEHLIPTTTEHDGRVQTLAPRSFTKVLFDDENTEEDEVSSGDDIIDDEEFKKNSEHHRLMVMDKRRNPSEHVIISERLDLDAPYTPPVHAKSEKQIEKLSAALLNCFIFQDIPQKNFASVIAAFERQKFEKGAVVIKEGDFVEPDQPGIFVLNKGSLDVYKKDKITGASKKLTKGYSKTGDIFGELACLYNQPRAVTVIATANCTVWSLQRAAFSNLVRLGWRNEMLELEEFIGKVELLKGLTKIERSRIADAMATTVYDVGERIITEGDIGDEFYIISHGKCVALKGDLVVKEYAEHEYFGELALINNAPRGASIIAIAETKVAHIKKDSFKRLLGSMDDILQRKSTYQDEEIAAPMDQVHEMSSDESDDLDEEERARRTETRAKAERKDAVVGESWVHDPNWVSPVYPKSDVQRKRLAVVLSRSFIFRALNPTDVNRVIDAFFEHRPKMNEVIITQGDEVSNTEPGLFVIEKGTYNVHKSENLPLKVIDIERQPSAGCCEPEELRAFEPEQVKKKYGPLVFAYGKTGQYFGELALLYNAPRAASVIATSPWGVMWSISREVFNNVVKSAMLLEKERGEKMLKRVVPFNSLPDAERNKVADVVKPVSYLQGEYVIRRGDQGDDMFILEEGLAVASIEGKVVKNYRSGDYFGERALLKDEPREADIIAVTDCRILALDKACFNRLLQPLRAAFEEKVKTYDKIFS